MPLIIIFLIAVIATAPANAYIGPGLGVAAVWMAFGPIAGIGLIVAIVAYFPLRFLWKKWQHKRKIAAEQEVQAKQKTTKAPQGGHK